MIQKKRMINSISTLKYKNISLKEMAMFPQWGYWKTGKIPCDAAGKNTDHNAFYLTLEEAAAGFDPNVHSGIGFSFRDNDLFVGIDYDHVVNDKGEITDPAIAAEVGELNTYTELSQSGTGIHCICKVDQWPEDIPKGTKKAAGELYYSGRYFAITGDVWRNQREIRTVESELIREIYNRLNPAKEMPLRQPQRRFIGTLSDRWIIERLQRNPRTAALYAGDISGYNSQSEADLSLCNGICFYTKDASQIDQIFRQSGLCRAKWDRRDYAEMTIKKAIDGTTGQYDPDYHSDQGMDTTIADEFLKFLEKRRGTNARC